MNSARRVKLAQRSSQSEATPAAATVGDEHEKTE